MQLAVTFLKIYPIQILPWDNGQRASGGSCWKVFVTASYLLNIATKKSMHCPRCIVCGVEKTATLEQGTPEVKSYVKNENSTTDPDPRSEDRPDEKAEEETREFKIIYKDYESIDWGEVISVTCPWLI